METRASKKRKQRVAVEKNELKERNPIDTISSDLPDDVLERIFSFLPIESLAQTIILSKHWRDLCLWRSHPHLDFSPLSPNPHPDDKPEKLARMVLYRRQHDSDINTFRLSGRVSTSGLRFCIKRVLIHRIEQLELDVCLGRSFDLPPCLFNSNTLRVLTLNHQNKGPGYGLSYRHFNYFTSAGLPSVHTLSLTSVHFKHVSDLFSGEKFPLLMKLCLKDCMGMYGHNINCPSLEILKLEGLGLTSLDISGIGLLELEVKNCFRYAYGKAKIFAPSLRRFHWEDIGIVKCITESFKCLNTGSFYFQKLLPQDRSLRSVACPNPSISTFISALCFAQSLSVRSLVLEILSNTDSKDGLPYSFNNLTTLELHTDLTKDEFTGIICFLISSPILHSITVGVNCSKTENESWDDDTYWISQSQNLKSFKHHLKVARIAVGGTKLSKSTVYLVKFLLRHETTLQELTLTLKSDPSDPPLVQETIRSQIMKFAQPSSNVIISFLPQGQSPASIVEDLY